MFEPIELISIEPSHRKHKKFMATFIVEDDNRQQSYRTVHFGDSRYEDYTIHKDPVRRENYWRRHKAANAASPMSASALAAFILWGPHSNLDDNIEFYREHFEL